VMEFTLSANYKTGGFTFIPEFRIDKTSEDSFSNNDGEAKNILPSINLAAVYKF
jgi:Putative beta-barrel porin-2, OmpL-like. bbp2